MREKYMEIEPPGHDSESSPTGFEDLTSAGLTIHQTARAFFSHFFIPKRFSSVEAMLKKSGDGSVWIRSGRVSRPIWLRFKDEKKTLGHWGEWVALRHLRRLGWDIVARNWKSYEGEVDLIAYDEAFLVFVEVKTRKIPSPLPPEETVSREKERKIDELAFSFQLRHEIPATPVRLDIIAVETRDLRHFLLRHYMDLRSE